MTTTPPDAAGGRYEVQARRILRRGTVVVSDDTRHAKTTNLADAQLAAHALAADGFTVWIYLVGDGDGVRPTYVSVETLQPVTTTPSRPSGHPAGPARCVAGTPPTSGRGGTAFMPPLRPDITNPTATARRSA